MLVKLYFFSIMNKELFKFFYEFRVRYAEVDAQGIVFNAHYLTYFDCAVTEYYRIIKYNYKEDVKRNRKDFHVIKTIIDYKEPLLFDQIIEAGIRVSRIGRSSLVYDIALYPKFKKKLLAFGQTIQVYTDQIKKKSTPLSRNLINKIKKFEKNI